jgi:hypothetical protein
MITCTDKVTNDTGITIKKQVEKIITRYYLGAAPDLPALSIMRRALTARCRGICFIGMGWL